MVLFAKVVLSTLALLPFFVFIEKRLGQHCQKIRISLHLETLAGNVARILLNRKKDLMKSLYNNVYLQAYFEYKRLEKI